MDGFRHAGFSSAALGPRRSLGNPNCFRMIRRGICRVEAERMRTGSVKHVAARSAAAAFQSTGSLRPESIHILPTSLDDRGRRFTFGLDFPVPVRRGIGTRFRQDRRLPGIPGFEQTRQQSDRCQADHDAGPHPHHYRPPSGPEHEHRRPPIPSLSAATQFVAAAKARLGKSLQRSLRIAIALESAGRSRLT